MEYSQELKKFNSQMKQLKQAFKDNEKFVLFIGAGQNGGANMRLMWNQLIGDVSRTSFRQLFQELGEDPIDCLSVMRALDIYSNKNQTDKTTVQENCDPLSTTNVNKINELERPNKDNNKGQQKNVEPTADTDLLKYIHTYFPIEIQVSMVKSLMKGHYIPALQKKLYSECNYTEIKKSFKHRYRYELKTDNQSYKHYDNNDSKKDIKELYTLFTIARMILLNPQIESVITYNFDNFIRQAVRVLLKDFKIYFSPEEITFLRKRFWFVDNPESNLADKVLVKDIHDNKISKSKNVGLFYFPVYHVHGYIPDPDEEEIIEMPHIVMALEEFVEQQTDGLSWQDSVQIDAFRNANVIFLGCSMTDLTMKRMINFAHTNGYSNKIYILSAKQTKDKQIKDEQANDEKKKITEHQIAALEKIRERYFEELGATYITCPDDFNKLCDALIEITYSNTH